MTSYQHIAEKYLPDSIIDNVAYFPDGRYQVVNDIGFSVVSNTAPSSTFVLVPSDASSSSSSTASNLSGFRTLRCITVDLDPIAYTSEGGPVKMSAAIHISRESLTTAVPLNIVDQAIDYQFLERTTQTPLGRFILTYPGEIRLYSGDSIQLLLASNSESQIYYDVRFPYRFSYFIKYN